MIYNVVLNSNKRSYGSVSNATYTFDWSVLPESKYKVTVVFTSGSVDTTVITDIALLEVQLGQTNVFKAEPKQTQASTTNCIGFLQPNETDRYSFMYGDVSTIPAIFLNNKPNANDFNVKITTNDYIPLEWTDSLAEPMDDYMLLLTFETI